MDAITIHGNQWKKVAEHMGNRTAKACYKYGFKFIRKYSDNPIIEQD